MADAPEPRILPCGDAAVAVEFGDAIDPALNAHVLALDAVLAGRPWLVETVPTYRSLLVHYDPTAIGFAELAEALVEASRTAGTAPASGATWTIPVAYGGEHGIDLEATAAVHGITPDELVRRHSAPTYRVYMIGFLPGFAYLGGLDPTIATPRRTTPRLRTPPGTISIGGVQALVASIEAPSGWHLLGRTPVRNFMPGRDPVFLLRPGDRVRFRRIDPETFSELDRAAAAGEIVAEPAT
ncbi:5-oxoprolinase subunit PxpB [Enterovirga aerilata]|uniref:5-oxoprolinase subunit PxpB n=1 Tax=Enterovirga aerilata TaxID=2730920 RepID=A0A849IB71_9HYPH|nr:5-oxoprolinase subunit PxpB [Enterovirga sp. DB1703]NNM73659.1 5-oxoprolinase subunit PxpB [Enterovirga sp. DB1703]